MHPIYLDAHTTTRPSKRAVEAMTPFYETFWGIPTAPHPKGQELLPHIDKALLKIYRLLGARDSDHVIVTSSGSEAVSHVTFAAYLELAREKGKDHFLTTNLDEAGVILSYERLTQLGCEMELIPVNTQGVIPPDALIDHLTPRTALLSLSWANAMTGVIQPVAELAKVCHERGIWLHLDATHILGKLDFDLDEISPDFVSFNGDHLYAPKGTGALWIRSGLRIPPLILGGQDQNGFRAGGVTPLLMALGVAAEEMIEGRDKLCLEIAALRDHLERGLLARIPGAKILFQQEERLPTTTCVAIPGATSDALLYKLARKGVYASFGGGVYQQLSLQLEACGFAPPLTDCAVSFSLSRETTKEEIDTAIDRIAEVASELQSLSEVFFDG